MATVTTTHQTQELSSTKIRHVKEWTGFFRQCWRVAMPERAFETEVRKVALRFPLAGHDLYEAWARHVTTEAWVSWRIKMYLDVMLRLSLVTETDILKGIMRRLRLVFAKESKEPLTTAPNADASVLEHLSIAVLNSLQSNGGKSKQTPVAQSMRLFQLIASFTGASEAVGDLLRGPALALGNGLSRYLVAHVNDLSASGVLTMSRGGPPKILKRAFSKVVPRFIQILENSQSPYKESLALLQQQSKLQEDIMDETQHDATNLVNAVSYQQNVTELPVLLARASLLAFLSTLLTGRPKADDGNLRTFLNARYHDDVPSLIVDLIVTSFHALSAAQERKDNQEVIAVHKSFIANKLPLLLEEYSPLLYGGKTVGHYIGEALRQVDECYKDTPILVPSADSNPKQRLLLSSALIGLIQESQISSFLGYAPTQGLPSAGKYSKDDLVSQCQNDSKRIEQLIFEMIYLEGNTGTIARAVLELIHTSSATRDTPTLKILLNSFLKRPVTLNYMFLFAEPRLILQPLCQLLDEWPSEESTAEQHPVYDEFGSILLFISVCRHRYDLPLSSFARESPESFILTFFRRGFMAKSSKDLSDTDTKHLSGWIKGLFEGNGISDDTMSNCSPKDFYMLVATLVDQSLTACQAGVLSLDTVKGGFEFLYEPWLLPSLVPVLNYFSGRLWGIQSEAPQLDYIMPILTLLVKPKLSPDVAPIHSLLLSTAALPLMRSLNHVKNIHRRRPDVQPLLDLSLKNARAPVTNTVPFSQYEKWLNIHGGGLAKTLGNAFDDLFRFNNPGKDKQMKPSYDHRLFFQIISAIGAYNALDVLLEQAWKCVGNPKQQDYMLDTLAGLIAAHDTDSPDGKASLRNVMQLAMSDIHKMAKRQQPRADFLVRLHRRIEAYCSKPIEQIPVVTSLDAAAEQSAQQEADLDASAVAAVTAVANANIPQTSDLMAGIEQVAAMGDVSQMTQDTDSSMNMGDMADISINDFIQDLDMLGGQSVDEIFNSL